MDKKKIIIIVILLLIIVGLIWVILSSIVNYETIEITSNGTTIDVPANQTQFCGQVSGVKIWNWDKGILVTYNTHEDSAIKVGQLSFNVIKELIDKAPIQEVDGFRCHVINADELLQISIFDVVKLNYNGKLYCISTSNQTSQDNVIICCNNKDIAVHMAKSLVYKNVYPNDTNSDNININIDPKNMNLNVDSNNINLNVNSDTVHSKIDTITDEIKSKSPIKL